MRKRVKLNSYEPFVRDKNMKFVTHSWYNKILSFGTPFELLKTYKIFQCMLMPGCCYERSPTEVDQGEKILLLSARISERASERLQLEYTPIGGE